MEFWDIYDADKKPTGRTMKRNDWCLKRWRISSDSLRCGGKTGQNFFLITKRVMTKAWAPGWWEVSGAAQAGEESRDAVLREVKEETGLDASQAEGGYLFYL